MVVECGWCRVLVNGKELGSYETSDQEDGTEYRFTVSSCPNCSAAIFTKQTYVPYISDEGDPGWGKPERLWPYPDVDHHWSIPKNVRNSLIEARKALNATAFEASSVMCGKALEQLCREFKIKQNLFKGLAELRKNDIIDKRLYEWGDEIRKLRNVGAHANDGDETVDPSDAKDLLEFTEAICDYVFVLSTKFENFKERKAARAKKSAKKANPRVAAKPVPNPLTLPELPAQPPPPPPNTIA